MARRHKRRPELTETELQDFVTASTAFHKSLREPMFNLAVTGEQYAALSRLHRALVTAIIEVTGEDPPWMRLATADQYPGAHRRDEAES